MMSLGRFRPAPHKGHLDRAKRVVGYLKRHPDASIRFRAGIPNYDGIPVPEYDWMNLIYGNVEEEIDPRWVELKK